MAQYDSGSSSYHPLVIHASGFIDLLAF